MLYIVHFEAQLKELIVERSQKAIGKDPVVLDLFDYSILGYEIEIEGLRQCRWLGKYLAVSIREQARHQLVVYELSNRRLASLGVLFAKTHRQPF